MDIIFIYNYVKFYVKKLSRLRIKIYFEKEKKTKGKKR